MLDAAGAAIAQLYRRAGFGATPAQIEQGRVAGFEATVGRLLDRSGPDDADAIRLPDLTPAYFGPSPTAAQRQQIQAQSNAQLRLLQLWWLDRMVASSAPLREKLTFVWHGYFATSNDKVGSPLLMALQNESLRAKGAGNFDVLLRTMTTDPAMMVWLDSNNNRKGRPNENFARELMELFSLGIGNYTDGDVREAARAFTGWVVDRSGGTVQLQQAQADYGPKTILGRTDAFRAEDVDALLARSPATARHVAARLWSRLVFPVTVEHPVVASLATSFAADLDVTNLLRRILLDPALTSVEARTGLVKEPVEWVVGALRTLGITATTAQTFNPSVLSTLELLGQSLFAPPSVGGWPQNTYWLSTQATLARLRFANVVATRADLSWLDGATPAARSDQLALRFGLAAWSRPTAAALLSTANPQSQVVLALTSPDVVLN